MMKPSLKILLFVLVPILGNGQQKYIDSLNNVILTAREDTAKIKPLLQLAQQFLAVKPDTSAMLARRALLFSRQNKLVNYEVEALYYLSIGLSFNPNEKDSAQLCLQQAFYLARLNKLPAREAECFMVISQEYIYAWAKPDSGILLARQGIALADKNKLMPQKINLLYSLVNGYALLKRPDSALQACLDGISISAENKSLTDEKQFSDGISYLMSISSPDTARQLLNKAVAWTNRMHEENYEASFEKGFALNCANKNEYAEALKAYMRVLELYKNSNDKPGRAAVFESIGAIYYQQTEYRKSLLCYMQRMELQKELHDSMIMYTYERIGVNYAKLKMDDSAIYFAKESYQEAARAYAGNVDPGVLDDLGELYSELGQNSIAMNYFQQSLSKELARVNAGAFYDASNFCEIYIGIAKLYKKAGQMDSGFHYAAMALPLAQQNNLSTYIIDASSIISDFYKGRNRMDSAFAYMEMANRVKDSLFSQEKIKEVQKIAFDEEMRQQQAEEAQATYRSRVRSYILFGGLALVLLTAVILYRNNRQKQKTNHKLERTLSDLKAAQSQLIQSEKMASLGELTAGIAHEIQNPLNFVNNFSEVNNELIEELKSQESKVKTEDRDEILNDIFQNNEKISFHGKRADAIVKGMLQHSRTSSGQKELTDINALCEEYLRLAYHGLRAKEKDFDVNFETNFDTSIGKINIVPQEIGRVLLNLVNNALFAVLEKKRNAGKGYKPVVVISTGRQGADIRIEVTDNGNGIAANIIDKIFQPFFTTKPTGQGTGLGLSLSYDIVKAHGGEIKVETTEGEGSKFSVELPLIH